MNLFNRLLEIIMKELWILNINYSYAKALANDWVSIFHNIGCEIYINAIYDRMIIAWEKSNTPIISHVIDFVYRYFDDVLDYSNLESAIKNLKDNQAVVFDSDNGDIYTKNL